MDLALQRYAELTSQLRREELAVLTTQTELERFLQQYQASAPARQVVALATNRIPEKTVIALCEEFIASLPRDSFFTKFELLEWTAKQQPEALPRVRRGHYLALGRLIFDHKLERAGNGYRTLA